jgi:hypothetical protein
MKFVQDGHDQNIIEVTLVILRLVIDPDIIYRLSHIGCGILATPLIELFDSKWKMIFAA